MLLTNSGAGDAFGGPGHQVWRWSFCGDTVGRRRRLQRYRRASPSSLGAGSLLGYCWPTGAQTTPLAALVTKFGRGVSLWGYPRPTLAPTTLTASLAIKFGGGFADGMLLADDARRRVFNSSFDGAPQDRLHYCQNLNAEGGAADYEADRGPEAGNGNLSGPRQVDT